MRVTWLTDMDQKSSGYGNLSRRLMLGLHDRGHRIICIGSGYRGQEHDLPFPVIPANLGAATAMIRNLLFMKEQDALVVALDIVHHDMFLAQPWRKDTRYVGIFPVESDPLIVTWAARLHAMDERLVLSKFGLEQLNAAGVSGKYLPISLDTEAWRPPGEAERAQIRKLMGVENSFVVLTVGENQERKHLSRGMEIVKRFSDQNPDRPVKYWMVTTGKTPIGWNLQDYAAELDLTDRFGQMEKGMPQKNLWAMFAAADAFLLPSKCEGLGMCAIEAMATGLPVAATNCSAITELLEDGRGFPIPYDYAIRDPFMNTRRYCASIEHGAEALHQIATLSVEDRKAVADRCIVWVRSMTLDASLNVIEPALEGKHV